jgi:hypothetical protein
MGAAIFAGALIAAPAALAGDGSFPDSLASQEGTAASPTDVAIADLNSDGHEDLVASNFHDDSITVRLGDGAGGFTALDESPYLVGGSPTSVGVGDFDNDGIEDLAVTNNLSGNVSIRIGTGFGNFVNFEQFGSPFGTGANPRSVAVGDFNNDGAEDLATANAGSDNVTVRLGNGAGGFATQPAGSPFPAGDFPSSIAIAEVNGDGAEDLLIANLDDDNVTIRLGNGAGGFPSAASGSPAGVGAGPGTIAVGDFNRDGFDDFATANVNGGDLSIALGNGAGSFVPAPGSPIDSGFTPLGLAVGDFNSDEIEDLAIGNASFNGSVTVRLGDGAGGFATVAAGSPIGAGTSLSATSIAVGDFDADATQDLAVINADADEIVIRRGGGPPADEGNLLVNGGAEAGPDTAASAVFGTETPIPGWTTTGEFSNHRYDDGSYPSRLISARIGGQEAFFNLGNTSGTTSATQTVDVSSRATAIDDGRATARLSGYLGGFGSAQDTMEATATFLDAASSPLGPPLQIGPVTREDRRRRTVLLRRAATGAVPQGTRSITVTLTGRHGDSIFQDSAYADRMALVLEPSDTEPPQTEITKEPKRKSKKPTAKLAFSSSEPDSGFECALAGKGVKKKLRKFKPCDSGKVKYKKLAAGKKKFKVRAIDPAGNTDPTPAKAKWKVV